MMVKDWLAERLHRFLGLALGAAALATAACGMWPHQARAEAAHPALWVIHDADSTVYLFGTIHVMKDGVDWLSPDLRRRFDSARDLWLEVPDLDDAAGVAQAMQKYALNPAGDMTRGLTDAEIRKIDALGAPYGLNADRLQGFKKWAAGLVLMTQKISAMGYSPRVGVDLTLLQAARTSGKPVHGFETLDQQMQILAPADEAGDEAALRQSLKDADTLATDLPPLLKAWEDGDEATLARELVDRMKKEDPSGYRRMIVARNAAWEPQVEDILKGKGTVFIAVGAGHLVGPDSLIAMLRPMASRPNASFPERHHAGGACAKSSRSTLARVLQSRHRKTVAMGKAMADQLVRQIRRQMVQTPPWVRDACIGLLAGGLAVVTWTALKFDAPVAESPAAVATVAGGTNALPGPTGAPLLWRVQNGQATVYLFGSIHVLKPGTDWMDKRLFQAFDSADAAWFEVPDLDALPHFKPRPGKVTAGGAVLTAGLTGAEKHQLETILNRYDTTTEEQKHVRPAVMASMIGQLDLQGGAFSVDSGVDMTLFHRAKALKHRTGGFEDNGTHYGYLHALGEGSADGTQALKRALAAHFGTGDPADSVDGMARAWAAGDERTLTSQLMAQKARDAKFYDLLLVKRNALWMPQVEALLKGKGTTFVVAGVDHFIGPDGLVAQLKRRGYVVTRVDP